MALLVMKFGGSSVADADCMRRVAARVKESRDQGNDVVVVVSAMGKTTDKLIELSREVNSTPPEREMDMLLSSGEQVSIAILAMTLNDMGIAAVSMTGLQAGFKTDAAHTRAKIQAIEPDRIFEAIREGHVVIVAGFQGLTEKGDIATLGRGGSDLSAVALAAGLKADRCQIYTDVEGVYTADPRVVPKAQKIDTIAYDEMLELASLGAKVLQSRSVEFAKKYNVKLEVLSSFKHAPGTIVTEEVENMEDLVVRGVAADKNQAKVTLRSVSDRPGIAASLFKVLSEGHINVDMIVQNISEEGHTDMSFTIPREDIHKTQKAVEPLQAEVGATSVSIDEEVAKVSIVGVGMRSHSGVAYKMFDALADNGINIDMISTSEIKISVVIAQEHADKAVQVLHQTFNLEATT